MVNFLNEPFLNYRKIELYVVGEFERYFSSSNKLTSIGGAGWFFKIEIIRAEKINRVLKEFILH